MLDLETFKTVVDATPLVSIDLIVRNENRVLLGRRTNKPAKGFWFTTGGRIYKDESIATAIRRIAKVELGISSSIDPKFIGVFEHFYEDSMFEGVSTHYVNLGYTLEVSEPLALPHDQHNDYVWMELEALMQDKDVHENVKLYFKG